MKNSLLTLILVSCISMSVGAAPNLPLPVNFPGLGLSAARQVPIGQILLGRHRHRRWNDRNNTSVRYETRTVYKGKKVYRDTYRITYKNGREKVKRVSHVRIG